MAEVSKFGLDALAHIRANRLANADIVEGLLFGLNGSGEIVVANAATGVKAVGVVVEGSPDNWGAAKTFSKTSTLKAGLGADLNKFAIIDVAEGTYSNAQIGAKIYLGASGAYTLTQNTTAGQLDQWVGMVWSTASVLINLTLDPEGTTVAASPTQVITTAGAGVVATTTNQLYLNNASTAITATIASAIIHEGIFFVKAGLEPAGGQDHTLTLTAGTFDGSNTIATFQDINDSLLIMFDASGNGTVLVNTGSVALS